MRIDPIELIINPNANNKKTFYFISGNEFTLMEKTKNVIFDIYNKESGFNKKKIKNISKYKNEIGIFERRNIIEQQKLDILIYFPNVFSTPTKKIDGKLMSTSMKFLYAF